jgi:hypothetical protein
VSYLGQLRLHFAGRFQAAVSTVNNNVVHFHNATFRPQDAQPPRGSWNPGGDGDWRLAGCPVTAAWHGDGTAAAPGDPITSGVVADSDRAAPAKLVDLDPQQQLVSQIWGLEMRICAPDGATFVRGAFEPAAFFDIWNRAEAGGGGGDIGACAAYQSVLTGVEWGDVSGSPWLAELQAAAADGLLSVKCMLDGYTMDSGDPEFTRGRIVGTIGPAAAAEPRHTVRGRQFLARGTLDGFFTPANNVNFCAAVVDEAAARVHVDLGNALPTQNVGGPVSDLGPMTLRCGDVEIGAIEYGGPDWYERTAGVVTLPVPAAAQATIAGTELAITAAGQTAIEEAPGGVCVHPDQFVYRLDPGETAAVQLFATCFGQPYAGAKIVAAADPRLLQGRQPPVATPAGALAFPAHLTAGPDGVATLSIAATDPGNPRGFIDGQVYGVRVTLEEAGAGYPLDIRGFVSLLVWNGFQAHDPPTWNGDLQPIFQQYANLYPVMRRFLDLGDYASVLEHRELLLLAFGAADGDSNQMPVTRDLSKAKRAAILAWLQNPLLGPPQPQPHAVAAAAAEPPAEPDPLQMKGGKAAAAARRLAVLP